MVELVWDARQHGTGRVSSGASLRVGAEAHFSPEDLLGLAAAGCLMTTFLGLAEAESVPLLSYLSTAELVADTPPSGPSRVRVRAYVTAATETDRARLEGLVERTKAASPIAGLLGDRVEVLPEFRVLTTPAPA